MTEQTNVNEMLAGREARYGSFEGHAEISQAITDFRQAMQAILAMPDDIPA